MTAIDHMPDACVEFVAQFGRLAMEIEEGKPTGKAPGRRSEWRCHVDVDRTS